jgi:hypothetical protein
MSTDPYLGRRFTHGGRQAVQFPPGAVAVFGEAISTYFGGTGVTVSGPFARQNSFFWEFKGRRFQFERITTPSAAERTEWWKVRLQVAITEKNGGEYVSIVGLPETRISSWALDTVPNDEK